MSANNVFYFGKTRKQRAMKFVYMALMCWFYIGLAFANEKYKWVEVPAPTLNIANICFSVVSAILLYIAWWHKRHPAKYEAILTQSRLIIRYPGSDLWSFDVAVKDIKRFENRQTLSHAGRGIPDQGVLLNDGTFHVITLNYDLSISDLHKAVRRLRPDVTYSKLVNKNVEGFLSKDYDK